MQSTRLFALFLLSLTTGLGTAGVALAQDSSNLPEPLPIPVAKADTPGLLHRKAAESIARRFLEDAKQFGYLATVSSVAEEAGIAPEMRSSVKNAYFTFSTKLRLIQERIYSEEYGDKVQAKEKIDSFYEDITSLNRQYREKLIELLGEPEFEALKSAMLREQASRMGFAILLTRQLGSEMKLTAEQTAAVLRIDRRFRKEIRREMNRIQADSQKQMTNVLNENQKKILDELLIKPVENWK